MLIDAHPPLSTVEEFINEAQFKLNDINLKLLKMAAVLNIVITCDGD